MKSWVSSLEQPLDIKQFISEHAARVDEELKRLFPTEWQINPILQSSIHYSLTAGGKRLRPVLLFAAVKALQGDIEHAIPVACAIEMIHTYSLIHDDLPAMDNDDYRRGKLTNHRVYGDAMAILAGDGLLTHAFYVLARARETTPLSAEQVVQLIEELAMFAGPRGMVGGQAADISGEQGVTSIDQLEAIHKHKTGDLIAFSLRAGGHIAAANETQLEALQQFGYQIGLAFQIQDDVLDLIGDEAKLGKQVQSDVDGDKVTYPYFLGLEESQRKVKQLTEQGKQIIAAAQFPDPHILYALSDYLVERDH